jgi:DNA-binding MarR family transcriptional regulator
MASAPDMTKAQSRVWRYIRKFHGKRGYPPSIAKIADHLGCTKQAVSDTLSRLVRDGHARRVADVGSFVAIER